MRKGRYRDDFGEHFVQVGSNFPFPESGITATAFLHGVVKCDRQNGWIIYLFSTPPVLLILFKLKSIIVELI